MSLIGIIFIVLFTYTKSEKLGVEVYYEALCPASINFITTQLYPSYKDIGKYIKLDLVPFGKASYTNSSGHWEFQCQHGPIECYNNKIQSCVIANYSVVTGLNFVKCAMGGRTNGTLQRCAKEADVPWTSIENCLNSGEANTLLINNGIKTKAVQPPIRFIPTITINGHYNENMENKARSDFLKLICQLLKNQPDVCKRLSITHNIII